MPQVTSATSLIDKLKPQIDENLSLVLKQARERARIIDPEYGRLWESIERQAANGGKRLRPLLTLLSYQGFGGDSGAIGAIATSQELLHLSLIIHDDIMDRDHMRRGRANVAGEYVAHYRGLADAEHLAMSAAILAGDLVLAQAHELLAMSDFEPSLKLRASQVMSLQLFEVAAGQLLDMEAPTRQLAASDSLKIARLKTSSYSFEGPLCIGAVLAGVDDIIIAKLASLGSKIGIGFQLADDLIGTFGDEYSSGKSVLSDMRAGKSTYLYTLATELAAHDDRNWLAAHWGQPDASVTDLEKAKSIIERSGAKARTEELMNQFAAEARTILQELKMDHQSEAAIATVIDRSVARVT